MLFITNLKQLSRALWLSAVCILPAACSSSSSPSGSSSGVELSSSSSSNSTSSSTSASSSNSSSSGSTGSSSSSNSSSSSTSSSSGSAKIEGTLITLNGHNVYLNGMNLAWIDFARDFGDGFNEAQARQAMAAIKDSGGNSLRWWVHTDGSYTPAWSNGLVSGPGGSLIADLQRALDIAEEYEVYIIPSLWSFDMLKDNSFRNPPNEDNYRLLSENTVLDSYIDNALIPMVQALNDHPQLIAWELFNEPENMTESWFFNGAEYYGGTVPTKLQLQRTQAKMAAAIHKAAIDIDQTALVTTGSKSMGKYNSDVAGGSNWYRDDVLIAAAGGDTLAVLDFYEPHYYNNEGKNGAWSPFHHDASYWGVDKPIVIGEFHIETLDVLGDSIAEDQLCSRLKANGYAGGWSWSYSDVTEVEAIKECMANVE